MSATIHSFQGFKDELARKEQERKENYAKIPKLKTGKGKTPRALDSTKGSKDDPRDLSPKGRVMDKTIDKVEEALFELCSAAEAVEHGGEEDLSLHMNLLVRAKDIAWRAYADLRDARAGKLPQSKA